MKIYLYGDVQSNTGPANVNKAIIKNENIKYVKSKKKFAKIIENFYKITFCSTVVFSGIDRLTSLYVNYAKFFRKKVIYLMHGYVNFENDYNKLNLSSSFLNSEKVLLEKCDLILPVSENFSKWFLNKRPEYKNKIHFLTNGIDSNITNNNIEVKRKNNLVIATGGNRNLKCNKNVAEAINNLNSNGVECFLSIYGRTYEENEKISESNNVKLKGMIPQDELYNKLRESKLYVLNTVGESFSLSVIEALLCGCNVLVSKNAGVCSILELCDTDIINDCNDLEELSTKIKYNLLNDNNQRILKKLDIEHYSWKKVSERLVNICKCLETKEDYTKIK